MFSLVRCDVKFGLWGDYLSFWLILLRARGWNSWLLLCWVLGFISLFQSRDVVGLLIPVGCPGFGFLMIFSDGWLLMLLRFGWSLPVSWSSPNGGFFRIQSLGSVCLVATFPGLLFLFLEVFCMLSRVVAFSGIGWDAWCSLVHCFLWDRGFLSLSWGF